MLIQLNLLYWQKRQASKPKYFFKTRQILWRRQEGKCLVCLDSIDNGENVQVHHKILKRCGGTDHINNLCLLHTNCHRRVFPVNWEDSNFCVSC